MDRLNPKISNTKIVYMDNASTTRPFPEVIETMTRVNSGSFGNPSSLHRLGSRAEKLIQEARQSVADLIKADKNQIFFTSGGTESNNWALFGTFRASRNRFEHIITSPFEHPSINAPLGYLNTIGCDVSLVSVDEVGIVNPEEIISLIRDNTRLISIMLVQNEIGSIEPIEDIGRKLAQFGPNRPLFHVDAVQGFAKLEIDVEKWGVDLLTISSHKIHGPKGVGALYIRKGVSLLPLIFGGGQEGGFRSGTENVANIAGFGTACSIWAEYTCDKNNRLAELRQQLIVGIEGVFPEARLNGPRCKNVSPYIVNFSFPGFRGETLVHALEKRDVFVSSGSACTSRAVKPSPVILALGKHKQYASSALRFSMSPFTNEKEIETVVNAVDDALKELKPWRQSGI